MKINRNTDLETNYYRRNMGIHAHQNSRALESSGCFEERAFPLRHPFLFIYLKHDSA